MNEKDLELADSIAQAQRDNGILFAQLAVRPEKHPEFDGLHCVDCEVSIPAPRLAMGRVRCVECQEDLEKRLG